MGDFSVLMIDGRRSDEMSKEELIIALKRLWFDYERTRGLLAEYQRTLSPKLVELEERGVL